MEHEWEVKVYKKKKKKLSDLISEFNEINIQKPILFLYPTNQHVEFEIYKKYHL